METLFVCLNAQCTTNAAWDWIIEKNKNEKIKIALSLGYPSSTVARKGHYNFFA